MESSVSTRRRGWENQPIKLEPLVLLPAYQVILNQLADSVENLKAQEATYHHCLFSGSIAEIKVLAACLTQMDDIPAPVLRQLPKRLVAMLPFQSGMTDKLLETHQQLDQAANKIRLRLISR